MTIEEMRVGMRVRNVLQKITGTVRRVGGERVTDGWVMVEWDIRKGLLIATNPAILEPEVDLRVH